MAKDRLIIFDFDDTLFDTYGFYEDLLVRLNALYGLDAKAFDEGSAKHFKWAHGAYDFYAHLKEHLSIKRDEFKGQLVGALPHKSYIFKDAARTLKRLKASGTDIVILTVGLRNWQSTKFEHAPEVRGFAKQMIQVGKGEYLAPLLKESKEGISLAPFRAGYYKEIILVDDNVVNFQGLENCPPGFKKVRLYRKGTKSAQVPTPPGIDEIKSLNELV